MKKIYTFVLVTILLVCLCTTNVLAFAPPTEDTTLEEFTLASVGTTREYGTIFTEVAPCAYGETYGRDVCFGKPYVSVSARADKIGGYCPSINVALERKIGAAYFTVCSCYLPTDGVARGLFSAQSVASGGTYRFTYTISSSSTDTVEVYLCAIPHD